MSAPKVEPWRLPGFKLAHYGGLIYTRGKGCRLWLQWYQRGTGGQRGETKRIPAAGYLRIPQSEMSLQKAKAALEEVMQKALGGAPVLSPREARSRTVNDLLDAYFADYAAEQSSDRQKQVERQRVALQTIRPWFGELVVGSLGKPLFLEIVRRMRERGLKDGSVATYFARLRACLEWAHDEDPPLLATVPRMPDLPAGPARQELIPVPDFERLRAKLPPHHAEAATGIFLTGLREDEVLSLEWDRVDFERNELTLRDRDTKTGKPRTVPMLPPMRALLLKRRAASPVGARLVFALRNGRQISPNTFGFAWNSARRRSGVAGHPTPHDLRRTAYDRFLDTLPLEVAMKLMGHRSLSSATRYLVIHRAKLHKAAEQYAASPRGRSEGALVDGLDKAPRRLAAVRGGRA